MKVILRRGAAAVIASFLVVSLAAAAADAAGSPKPNSHQVTSSGQALYEYEALIHQTFGSKVSVCTGRSGCHSGWFYAGALSPLSSYSSYQFAFTDFGKSSMHMMPTNYTLPSGTFGNYPSPVTLNGRYIACDSGPTMFLTTNFSGFGAGNYACLPRKPY